MLHRVIASAATLATALLLGACATTPLPPTAPAPASVAAATESAGPGLVTAADPRAAEAGVAMLRQGG
ncbi:MAG: gamma-glutamyltransferase, partial [Porphyrobacter sp.]|nr:gamma-glutamyltransferase [Porphyrobacter sp.]